MYERLYICPRARARHSNHFWAEHLERYAYNMLDVGYSGNFVFAHVYWWENFLLWCQNNNLKLSNETEDYIHDYIDFLAKNDIKKRSDTARIKFKEKKRAILNKLLLFLRKDNFIPAIPTITEWYTASLNEYCRFLDSHLGIGKIAINRKSKDLVNFLKFMQIHSWDELKEDIVRLHITSYVKVSTEGRSVPTKNGLCSNLRGILHYWHLCGLLDNDLSAYVFTVRSYKLGSVPSFISSEDISRILNSFDRKTPVGCRNHLIVLLLSTYGWRGGELRHLTLDDINWRNNIITIHHTKIGQTKYYPLFADIGEAIIAYLKNGRPHSQYRELILHSCAPIRPLQTLWHIVSRAINHLEIKPLNGKKGTHVFRHSRAVSMLDHGIPMKSIGDILGHSSAGATMIYTKVDLTRLRSATLDVIGEWQ